MAVSTDVQEGPCEFGIVPGCSLFDVLSIFPRERPWLFFF